MNSTLSSGLGISVSDESTGGVAPWVGYEDEDILEAMKAKILSLSVDKRYYTNTMLTIRIVPV